jgi:membrane fusion protein (multidrug efflux system)
MHLSRRARRIVLLAAAALIVAGVAWWLATRNEVSTDDAYVNADVAQIAALVSGPVVAVHVADNAIVHRGDPLFDVDPQPFEVALERAKAQLAQAERGVHETSADVDAQRAAVARAEADLANFRSQLARTDSLRKQNFVSQQAVDDAIAKVRTQEAAVRQAQAQLERAIASAQGGVAASPDVLAARAGVAQAELDLQHTQVVAPGDGRLTGMTLARGSTVNANAPLFVLIGAGTFRVDANFKETQLAGIRPGQRADIEVDMYPHHAFEGVVESVSGGTGAAFSLLPPQNATGNWVKVTQRVPVRVAFARDDANFPLRVGATATVTVHVK